jgi:ADP-heptose:LPS heptosyltransferase
MSNKYYIHLAGGLGDHLLSYFGGNKIRRGPCGGFGFLDQLKEEQPDSEVKVIAHPTQPGEIKKFFRFHPHISKIEEYKWCNPCHVCKNEEQESKGYTKLDDYGRNRGWKRKPNTKIFTSRQDEELISEIMDRGSFVIFHPFAGEKARIPVSDKDWKRLIDTVTRELECNAVVVGATHTRQTARTQNIEESFNHNNKSVFNLVNKASLRASAKLIQLSKAAVLTHSAMFCAASHGLTPTVIVTKGPGHVWQRIRVSYVNKDKIDVLPTSKKPIGQIETELIECLNKVISDQK